MTTIGSRLRLALGGGNAAIQHRPPSGCGKPSTPAGECHEEDGTPSVATAEDDYAASADAPPTGRSGLRDAAAEARFRLAWGLSARFSPVLDLAARLAASPAAPGKRVKNDSAIPRRWYISHMFFWAGSGTACWFQFRHRDRAAARRHLVRSLWIPPLVWLVSLTAVGMAIPDEAVIDMVRNAPYARPP